MPQQTVTDVETILSQGGSPFYLQMIVSSVCQAGTLSKAQAKQIIQAAQNANISCVYYITQCIKTSTSDMFPLSLQ